MSHVQKEIYWIILMVTFLIERDAVVDVMMMMLTLVWRGIQ